VKTAEKEKSTATNAKNAAPTYQTPNTVTHKNRKGCDLLNCLTRLYILIKRHVEEIALENPNEYARRKKKKRSI
jgi:hypothetical protein